MAQRAVYALFIILLGVAAQRARAAESHADTSAEAGKETPSASALQLDDMSAIETLDATDIEQLNASHSWFSHAHPAFDRALNLMTARPNLPGDLQFIVAHRTRQGFGEERPFHDFLGFDAGGLKIGLGLRFGVVDNLDVGVYRLNGVGEIFDVYEFDGRYRFLTQENEGIDLALRVGLSWFSQRDAKDAAGYFAQLIASAVLANRVVAGAGVIYHTDSTNRGKTRADDDATMALTGLCEVRINDMVAWDFEVAVAMLGFHESNPSFSTGPKIITNRHTFAIVLSNSQYMSTDGIITNSKRNKIKELILGFNITREFNFGGEN